MQLRPLVIGHRGGGGHAPENTLAAFRQGLAMGADGVECDVHLSRDGRIVVIHDATLERTSNGTGRVRDLSLAELQALDAGSWFGGEFAGERIPTLEAVFEVVRAATRERGRDLRLVVELKHGDDVYPGMEEALVRAIAGTPMVDQIEVIAFDHLAIARIKERAPGLRVGVLYDGRPVDSTSMAIAAGADLIGPSVKWVDAREVSRARAAELGIFVWTANSEDAMRRMLNLGVTAVGTDYPDRLLALRESSCFPASNFD